MAFHFGEIERELSVKAEKGSAQSSVFLKIYFVFLYDNSESELWNELVGLFSDAECR